MSDVETKERHSKRIHRTSSAIAKQVKIAKSAGFDVREPHKFAKHHALDCGVANCPMCSSARKLRGERSIQEKRFYQDDGRYEYQTIDGENSEVLDA